MIETVAEKWISVRAASNRTRLSRYRLLAYAAAGEITAQRIGGRLCLLRADVEALPEQVEGASSQMAQQ